MPELREVVKIKPERGTVENALLEYIQSRPMRRLTISDMARGAGIPGGSVPQVLTKLLRNGRISRHHLGGHMPYNYGYTVNGPVEVQQTGVGSSTSRPDRIIQFLKEHPGAEFTGRQLLLGAGISMAGDSYQAITRMIDQGLLKQRTATSGRRFLSLSDGQPVKPKPAITAKERVLAFLQDGKRHTAQEITEGAGISSRDFAYQIVNNLVHDGVLDKDETQPPYRFWMMAAQQPVPESVKPIEQQPRKTRVVTVGSRSDLFMMKAYIYIADREGRVVLNKDLGRFLGVSGFTASRVVDRLEEAGYVKRLTRKYTRYQVLKPWPEATEEMAPSSDEVKRVQTVENPPTTPVEPAERVIEVDRPVQVIPFKEVVKNFAWEKVPEYNTTKFALEVLHDLVEYAYKKYEDPKEKKEEDND